MKQDDLIRRSIEQCLSDLRVTPLQRQRLAEEIIGGRKMKKKLSYSAAIVAVAVLIGVTALGAGLSGMFSSVNWLGEVSPEAEPALSVTPAPTEPPEGEALSTFDLEQSILNDRADRELVAVTTSNGGVHSARTHCVSNMEEFRELLSAAPELPVPAALPEGYRFSTGVVLFDCLPEGAFELTSRETLPEGITVSRYAVDPAMDFISGYSLSFTGSDAHDYITVDAVLTELTDASEYAFSVNPDQQAHAIRLDGMDNALSIASGSGLMIAARRTLAQPVEFLRFMPDRAAEIEVYGEAQIRIFATRAAEAELFRMLKGD